SSPTCTSPSPVAIDVTQTQSLFRILVTLKESLPRGHVFQLELVPIEIKAGPNPNDAYSSDAPAKFAFATRRGGEKPVGDTTGISPALGDSNTARDLMKFGNLLLVRSASGQLVAMDVTDPRSPQRFARMLSVARQIRAFATDSHNRLFYVEQVASTWAA